MTRRARDGRRERSAPGPASPSARLPAAARRSGWAGRSFPSRGRGSGRTKWTQGCGPHPPRRLPSAGTGPRREGPRGAREPRRRCRRAGPAGVALRSAATMAVAVTGNFWKWRGRGGSIYVGYSHVIFAGAGGRVCELGPGRTTLRPRLAAEAGVRPGSWTAGQGRSERRCAQVRALRLRADGRTCGSTGLARLQRAPHLSHVGPGPIPKARSRAPVAGTARTLQYALSQSHLRMTFSDKIKCIFPHPR